MWGSFNEATVRRLATVAPHVPRVFSSAGILRLLLAYPPHRFPTLCAFCSEARCCSYYSGVLPFISLRDHQYRCPSNSSKTSPKPLIIRQRAVAPSARQRLARLVAGPRPPLKFQSQTIKF